MNDIEVEIRSFLDEDQYRRLLIFFNQEAKLVKEDHQVTHYFDAPKDLRIQKNSFGAKIWLKEGQIHDDARREIEIRFAEKDFEKMEALLTSLGYPMKVKWTRHRLQYDWFGVKACLDQTRGYGCILELEMLTDEPGKSGALLELKNRLATLDVVETPKEVFENRYRDYMARWQELTAPVATAEPIQNRRK